MILDLIPVLNAFIILAAVVVLGRTISKNYKNEQEFRKVREDRLEEMIEEIKGMMIDINKFVND